MQLSFSPSYSKCEVFVWVRLTVEVYAFPHILWAGVCLISILVHNSRLTSLICNRTRFCAALYALQSSSDWDFKASCCKKTLCRISDNILSLITYLHSQNFKQTSSSLEVSRENAYSSVCFVFLYLMKKFSLFSLPVLFLKVYIRQ